jgi:hypothetical protein
MARGQEAKLRRRNRKKEDASLMTETFGDDDGDEIPMPPSRNTAGRTTTTTAAAAAAVEEDTEDEERDEVDTDNMPKKKKKKRAALQGSIPAPGVPQKGGIKTLPLILLILMTGTTLLPVAIYASDYFSTFLAKNDFMGSIGYRFGIGAVPRKRVMSFYEKHAPDKIRQVPSILSKHYGDYPTLIKKLERKYQDYGYFMGWKDDEAPARMLQEYAADAYRIWIKQWNRFAPQLAKTAARNARYNITTIYKRAYYKIWKKFIWPKLLQPILGVPEGAERVKRQDAADARKRRPTMGSSSTMRRKKNRDFRDDEDDHE